MFYVYFIIENISVKQKMSISGFRKAGTENFVFLSSWRKLTDKILQERLPSMSVVLVGDCWGYTEFSKWAKMLGKGELQVFSKVLAEV